MLTRNEVIKIKRLQKLGKSGAEIIKETGHKHGTVYYWMKAKEIPKSKNFYRSQITHLRNRILELEAREMFDDKMEEVRELVYDQSYEYQERFGRAKAKHYKADEMLTDLRVELIKKVRKEESTDSS